MGLLGYGRPGLAERFGERLLDTLDLRIGELGKDGGSLAAGKPPAIVDEEREQEVEFGFGQIDDLLDGCGGAIDLDQGLQFLGQVARHGGLDELQHVFDVGSEIGIPPDALRFAGVLEDERAVLFQMVADPGVDRLGHGLQHAVVGGESRSMAAENGRTIPGSV